ncbi:hypothetical protein [Kribbella sp.]|uniref:hypothetical protein n=1 Tax=Kribbella sp. TaxID=1871183 RepID=UPI002D51CAC4|nr:hypothetical protein [Kribbella sp.]HZX08029.1 hypothetical protein [Kribbella sp.]
MDNTWVPESCTLPTAEQPLRTAEFDQLFTNHLRHATRPDAHTLELTLTPESHATTADLIARESECCSFFTFTLTEATILRITVPPTHTVVLDALASRLPR